MTLHLPAALKRGPIKTAMRHRHPVNRAHQDEATFAERLADAIAAFIGSWKFLGIQTGGIFVWVLVNSLQATHRIHLDPFPYILLNLAFSTQAAYTGPVLLLAAKRQSERDRLTLEHAAAEGDKSEQQNEAILQEIKRNTEVTLRILQHVTPKEAA